MVRLQVFTLLLSNTLLPKSSHAETVFRVTLDNRVVKPRSFYSRTSICCCRVIGENGLASDKNTAVPMGVDSSCHAKGAHAIKLLEWHAMVYGKLA